ncbi:MAG: peptidylprolyl isomerase [Phycisphaerales bacterium]
MSTAYQVACCLAASLLLAVAGCLAAGCASGGDRAAATLDMTKPVFVEMSTSAGDITLELDPVRAPISVENFMAHARAGHYDGTVFHRVIPTFVIQGGGWTPDLKERAKADAAAGRPDATIKNEWQNGLKNARGTIAMARESEPDSATREFYINVADNARLDTAREKTGNAGYAVFGRVIHGWEAVEAIRTGKTGPRPEIKVDDGSMNDVPLDPVVIRSVRVIDRPDVHE